MFSTAHLGQSILIGVISDPRPRFWDPTGLLNISKVAQDCTKWPKVAKSTPKHSQMVPIHT